MTDRPYSRVYWSIMDDAKFDGVREEVRHLGAWMIMLLVADMAYPAPAYVPPVPKASVRVLVGRGLVDLLPGGRYRIHGLDRERDERSAHARTAASARYARAVRGQQSGTAPSSAHMLLDETRRDETRQDETRQDETRQDETTRRTARSDGLTPLREAMAAAGLKPGGVA